MALTINTTFDYILPKDNMATCFGYVTVASFTDI